MQDIREELMGRAFLYDDPESYRAGVAAALDAVAKILHPASGSDHDHSQDLDQVQARRAASGRLELV